MRKSESLFRGRIKRALRRRGVNARGPCECVNRHKTLTVPHLAPPTVTRYPINTRAIHIYFINRRGEKGERTREKAIAGFFALTVARARVYRIKSRNLRSRNESLPAIFHPELSPLSPLLLCIGFFPRARAP